MQDNFSIIKQINTEKLSLNLLTKFNESIWSSNRGNHGIIIQLVKLFSQFFKESIREKMSKRRITDTHEANNVVVGRTVNINEIRTRTKQITAVGRIAV